jgi:hypothetical protein
MLIEFGEKLTPNQLVTLGKLGRDIMERFSEGELGQEFARHSHTWQASKNPARNHLSRRSDASGRAPVDVQALRRCGRRGSESPDSSKRGFERPLATPSNEMVLLLIRPAMCSSLP